MLMLDLAAGAVSSGSTAATETKANPFGYLINVHYAAIHSRILHRATNPFAVDDDDDEDVAADGEVPGTIATTLLSCMLLTILLFLQKDNYIIISINYSKR
jgi:hypothetical protein